MLGPARRGPPPGTIQGDDARALLAGAGIQPVWSGPPTAEEIHPVIQLKLMATGLHPRNSRNGSSRNGHDGQTFEALTEDDWTNLLVPHFYMGPLPSFFYVTVLLGAFVLLLRAGTIFAESIILDGSRRPAGHVPGE